MNGSARRIPNQRGQGDEFPDLKEITAFSVLVKDDPPPQP